MGWYQPYMNFTAFVVQCGNASPDNRVGQKSRGVLGDWAHILAHRKTAGLARGDPRAEGRVVPGKLRKRRDPLADKSFLAIRPLVLVERLAVDGDRHIRTLARIERLAHERIAKLGGLRIVIEIGGQQVRVAGMQRP